MGQTLTIRAGSIADLEQFSEHWMAMFEEVGNFTEREFPAGWRGGFRRYLRTRINANEAAFFVAVYGDAIVGTAGAILRDGYPSAVTQFRQGYIFGVRVAPEHRRQGIAERLTREAIDYLQRSNCRSIRLHASQFARSIYERIGFVPTNEMELNLPRV